MRGRTRSTYPRTRPGAVFPTQAAIPCWVSHPLPDFFYDPLCILPHFTFPIPKHPPPRRLQPLVISLVARLVLPQLLVPEAGVVHGRGVVLRTPMPETSVDENRNLRPSEAQVEQRLARDVVPALSAGMLCLADRNFFSYLLWNQARATGADLLWRIKKNLRLPRETPLADGSYLSRIYPSQRDRRHQRRGVCVRVIEYQLSGVADAEPLYRLLTTVLDAEDAPARELPCITSAGRSKRRSTS